MPKIEFKTKYTGAIPGVNLTQREWNTIVREAWSQVGHMFHKTFVKKHFTKAGAREYGYTPRKGEEFGRKTKARRKSYIGKKKQAKDHELPLVWSGDTRTAAKRANIKSFAMRKGSGVRVILRLPNLSRLPKGGRIDMIDEMFRISDREKVAVIAFLDNLLLKKIKAIRRTTTTVIK